jgi:glutamate synthase (NADPH/NADH) small chain
LEGVGGHVTALHGIDVGWTQVDGRWEMKEIEGTEFELQADLVLLATGFTSPVHDGLLAQLGVALDARGNVSADTDNYQTNMAGVFAAGDTRRGQSLVVWAIREGRQCAASVDRYLMESYA